MLTSGLGEDGGSTSVSAVSDLSGCSPEEGPKHAKVLHKPIGGLDLARLEAR